MKKILYICVVALFFGVSIWYVWMNRDDAYDVEDMVALAEQGECAQIGEISSDNAQVDGYGYWYFNVVPTPENEDMNFDYSCEVNPYTGETRLFVEEVYNWYESDFD